VSIVLCIVRMLCSSHYPTTCQTFLKIRMRAKVDMLDTIIRFFSYQGKLMRVRDTPKPVYSQESYAGTYT
jgi:hypothetical protein